MKVVFLARAGVHVTWLAGRLEKDGVIDAVIYESGAPARQRKLRRHFNVSPFSWPGRVLDLFALLWLGRRSQHFLAQRLDSSIKPFTIPVYTCEDANDEEAHRTLRELKPDLVFVYGTAILKPATLRLAPLFLNLHGGMVPKYRNVHSEFWALAQGRPQDVGSSVLYVTPGIDSGPIALRRAVRADEVTDLSTAQALNIELGALMATEAIRAWREGTLAQTPQHREKGSMKPTPTWRDIWRHRKVL